MYLPFLHLIHLERGGSSVPTNSAGYVSWKKGFIFTHHFYRLCIYLERGGWSVLTISTGCLSWKSGFICTYCFCRLCICLERAGSSVLTISTGYLSILKEGIHLCLPFLQVTVEELAKIAHKNRKQGENNPFASFQKAPDVNSIATKAMLCHPITMGMTGATADGSAAAIVCSETFVQRHGLQSKAVEILTQHMVTDLPSSFGTSFRDLCGYSMAKTAAQQCYDEACLTPNDVQVLIQFV